MSLCSFRCYYRTMSKWKLHLTKWTSGFSKKEDGQMLQRPVLSAVCGSPFNLEIVHHIVSGITSVLVVLTIERFQHIPFILRQFFPGWDEPRHVFHCLPVSLLQNINLLNALDDPLL